jgi:hypothetical protein
MTRGVLFAQAVALPAVGANVAVDGSTEGSMRRRWSELLPVDKSVDDLQHMARSPVLTGIYIWSGGPAVVANRPTGSRYIVGTISDTLAPGWSMSSMDTDSTGRWLADQMDSGIRLLRILHDEYQRHTGMVYPPMTDLASLGSAKGHVAGPVDGPPLLNAVVDAVKDAGYLITAEQVLKALPDHPLLAKEKDERLKRRKVSQALYANSGKRLFSQKPTSSGEEYRWGLMAWWDSEHEEFKPEYRSPKEAPMI